MKREVITGAALLFIGLPLLGATFGLTVALTVWACQTVLAVLGVRG